ncbi:hypothetical protein C900_01464 [Fulvivirga imtechensis AK7]|uniref:DUF4440 domain-containing protein n=1 Tax=Fulvivirga imtechensis AK7 TaxID=1237149 RepID=L8JXV3_9BACT|nr:hypothetical protein [Fulvivirga imtechensis]ELR72469.1 hypothetical protein C900_01464 [Fulvivirga imtechensis AK7]
MKRLLIAVLILLSTSLVAQEKMSVDTTAVHSIYGIVKEMLRIISGEKGKVRDWDAFRNLFLPAADFTILNHDESFSQPAETASLEELIELMQDPYYDQGFLEYEIHKVVDEYNGIAQVFQSYHVKDIEGEEELGINSYQLVNFNSRWWIVNVVWTGDSNGVDVPYKYLGK